MKRRVPGLVGHMCPNYGVSKALDAKVRDTDNAATFIEEYEALSKASNMPRFIMMS